MLSFLNELFRIKTWDWDYVWPNVCPCAGRTILFKSVARRGNIEALVHKLWVVNQNLTFLHVFVFRWNLRLMFFMTQAVVILLVRREIRSQLLAASQAAETWFFFFSFLFEIQLWIFFALCSLLPLTHECVVYCCIQISWSSLGWWLLNTVITDHGVQYGSGDQL